MTERIQKILSARGVASRRKAEELLLAGRISINGKIAELGQRADPDSDLILLDGAPIPSCQDHVYIMLNKPRGYVTTLSDELGRKTVSQLVADCGFRVYPVGRLDYDTEGLLLLTNDGTFANALMHPRHQVNKTYRVWVAGNHKDALERLQKPIVLDGYQIKKPQVTCLSAQGDRACYEITIHEGRNRQVRRMCQHAGLSVTRLQRIAEGSLTLGDLPLGTWRYLTEDEIAGL